MTSGDVNVVGNVNVGNNDGFGSVTISAGTLTAGVGMNVGINSNNGAGGGEGYVYQYGGTVTVGNPTPGAGYNSFNLGVTSNSSDGTEGFYQITGNTSVLNINSNADVGVSAGASGTLTIGSGSDTPTVNVLSTPGNGDGNLTIGDSGNGTLNMNSGTLSVAGTIQIGVNGTGTVNQSGGAISADYVDLSVPVGGGSSSYTMTGGALTTTADLNVGGSGAGPATFSQSAGGVYVGFQSDDVTTTGGTLYVGNVNGNASYTLSGTGSLNLGGDLNVGANANTSGTFNYNQTSGDAGTITFAGTGQNLVVGDNGTGVFNEGSSSNTTDLNLQTAGVTLDIGRGQTGNGTFNLAAGSTLEDDATVGDAGTGVFNNTGGTHSVAGSLNIGNQSTGNGTYNLTGGGMLTVGNFTTVGVAGTGTFLNDASTHLTQVLVIGAQANSVGLYTLQDGGSLTVGSSGSPGFMDVGETGQGTFTQNDSTSSTTVYGSLDVGRYAGCTGTCGILNLNAGSFTVNGFATVGDSGTGTINQGGSSTMTIGDGGLAIGRGESNAGGGAPITGTGYYYLSGTAMLNVTGGIDIASLAGNTGTMTQTGGAVNADNETIGDGGVGKWTQSGGTNTTTGDVNVGWSNTGSYAISGDSTVTLSVGGTLWIGVASGGNGSFTQSGTTMVSAAQIDLGDATGSSGSYTLNGGTLSGGSEYVGDQGQGMFTQSGGSNTGTLLSIANNTGGQGSYMLSSGTLTINGDTDLGAGANSLATMTQTGGTANLNGDISVGIASSNALSTYSLGGTGALNTTGNLDIGVNSGSSGEFDFNKGGGSATLTFLTSGSTLTVGDSGAGTFNQGGGDLNLKGEGVTLDIGAQAGSNGQYIMTGGTLEDDLTVGDAGTGSFTNSGGVHTVSGNLIVGNQSTGVGTYTLSGAGNLKLSDAGAEIVLGNDASSHGTFNFNTATGAMGTVTFNPSTGQQIIVGLNGNGQFSQGGGDLNLYGNGVSMDIAENSGSYGQYTLTGGTLETGPLKVGDGGQGSFINSGGTQTVNGNLIVGEQSNSAASAYTLGGTGNLTLKGNGAEFIIGDQAGSHGVLNFNHAAGDNATITFSGTGQEMLVGNSGNGVVNQNGGDMNLAAAGATLDIGVNANSFGQYNLYGGSLETGASLNVGDAGSGQFNQQAGTATINGNLVAGNQVGSSGIVTIGFGATPSLTVTGNATFGNEGYGSLDMESGATVDIKGSMTIANSTAGGGASIEGGSLTVGDGGAGNQLLITSNGSMKIEDTAGVGAVVTVDGTLTNDNTLELGNHDIASPNQVTTLTVTQGFTNNGTFNFIANSVLNANVTNGGSANSTALFTAQNGATTDVTLNGNMDNYATVNVSELGNVGSTLTQNGNFKNEAAGTLQVIGSNVTITGSGAGPALDNFGAVNISQNGNNNAASNVTVNGTVTNEAGATITVTKSIANWNGTFTNNGAYISDPSTQTFTTLNNGSTGYMTGGKGDVFKVTGDFLNTSNQKTLWSTGQETLEFSSTAASPTTHILQLDGVDDGAVFSGFTDNFAFGELLIDPDNSLTLEGTGTEGVTNALYVLTLVGLDISGDLITNIDSPELNIYYDAALNPELDGKTYMLSDGGELIAVGSPVPEPSTWVLFGVGFAGLAAMGVRRRRAVSA